MRIRSTRWKRRRRCKDVPSLHSRFFLSVNLLYNRGVTIHWFYLPDEDRYREYAHKQLRAWGRSEKIIGSVKMQDQWNILLYARIRWVCRQYDIWMKTNLIETPFINYQTNIIYNFYLPNLEYLQFCFFTVTGIKTSAALLLLYMYVCTKVYLGMCPLRIEL